MADEDATLDWNEPNNLDKQRARNLAASIVAGSQAHRDTHAMARWALWMEAELTTLRARLAPADISVTAEDFARAEADCRRDPIGALNALSEELAAVAPRSATLMRITIEALEERVRMLDIRRGEARSLLQRLVKCVREDRAVTPGKTRLARLAEQVGDYLERTHDPNDILRGDARLAPADSPPGDEELRKAIEELESEAPSDWAISVVCRAAAEARLRSRQPETEEQRAERLLGEWRARAGNDGYILSERNGWHGCSLFSTAGPVAASEGRTRAAAILNALAKARDAEGGKSPALTCPHCDESVSEDGGVEGPLGNLWHYRCLEAWRESDA